MKRITLKQQLRTANVLNVTYAIVSGLFASFINPSNRWVNFKWSNFPDMAARHTKSGIFMYFSDDESLTDKEKDFAAMEAKSIAHHLVIESGVVDNETNS